MRFGEIGEVIFADADGLFDFLFVLMDREALDDVGCVLQIGFGGSERVI